MNDFDINNDIYKQISGITENFTFGYYDDNVKGDAIYYTSEIDNTYDALDKVNFANEYDIKIKIISEYTSNLYQLASEVKFNLLNGEYLYIRHMSFERSNFLYDSYIKKHTLTLSFSAYVSNQ